MSHNKDRCVNYGLCKMTNNGTRCRGYGVLYYKHHTQTSVCDQYTPASSIGPETELGGVEQIVITTTINLPQKGLKR